MSTELAMLSNPLIFCCPLLLLPSIFPSIRVFSSESALCTRWPALASVLSVNIQGWFSLGLTGLISLRPRTLRSLLQHHNSKASFEKKKSIIYSVLSFLYGPTLTFVHDYWKTIDLTIHIFVSKVTSLLFNTLSRFVTASHHSGAGTKCWIFSPSKVHHVSLHQISLTYILPNSLVHNSLWRECSVRAGNFFSIVTHRLQQRLPCDKCPINCLLVWMNKWMRSSGTILE